MTRTIVVGIVGGGPAGLYAANVLVKKGYDVWLWEKEDQIGGRTKMKWVGGQHVVGGAGVVRNKDTCLKKVGKALLKPFISQYHIDFKPTQPDLKGWIKRLEKDLSKMNPSLTFEENMIRQYGKDALHNFIQWVGYTDFLKADVIDTVKDYSFEDCLPGQKMFMIDWDKLAEHLLPKPCNHFHLSLANPVTNIEKQVNGFLVYTKKNGNMPTRVNKLIWAAPRPSWNILDSVFTSFNEKRLWNKIKKGVQCQSFLRMYAFPLKKDVVKAKEKFPKHTLLSYNNPLGKVIPYGKELYMMSYADNKRADKTYQHRKDKDWLEKWSGIRWKNTKAFYFPCGTHYYTPLDSSSFVSREKFIQKAQHPLPNLFMAGEALSKNQGWTEGALESVNRILGYF